MSSDKKIIHVIIFMSILFFSIIAYLTYFQIFEAADLTKHPYNKRYLAVEDKTIRGNILDRNGVILAETIVEEDDKMSRVYNYNQLYSHVIGYSSKKFGKSGIESYYNDELLALTEDNILAELRESITGKRIDGNNLTLTISHNLQQRSESLLKGKIGSIVAMNPKTGEVLAMVSKPDYNPNTLSNNWEKLTSDERSPLLNRSLSGLYPPGSIYKPIIAAAILQDGTINTEYDCTGTINIDGYDLSDFNKSGHGNLDLRRSMIVSCNTNFARMGTELGSEKITNISKKFFVGKDLKSDMPISKSRYPYDIDMSSTDIAAVSIGQGKLLVTPMHMVTATSIFANDGVMMTPYILKQVTSENDRVLYTNNNEGIPIVSETIANEIKDMMVAVVNEGTGRNARINGIDVAGKTGTAQNETGEDHSWFIGFAPANDPKIAVAVILESEGRSGGAAAAPIAREVINQGLNEWSGE